MVMSGKKNLRYSPTGRENGQIRSASFYPNLSIKNRLYPEHLGEEFCDAYEGVYKTRKTFPKGSSENNAYKLALNGSYGGSNNKWSPFFDSKYTMQITINGQLLLLMLVEQLIKTPGLRMIQANTDGVTYLCPRGYIEHTRAICKWWEGLTKLELEEVLYESMFVRDVNNYLCKTVDGKIKRIGAYASETQAENPGTRELPWYKDWSAIVVAKAAQAYLLDGVEVEDFMYSHKDKYEFLCKMKVPKGTLLRVGDDDKGRIIRYYVSRNGEQMQKVMPPSGPVGEYKRANKLTDEYFNSIMEEIGPGVWDERIHTKNKSTYPGERVTNVHTGYKVTECNKIEDFDTDDIDYDWYIDQARKLIQMENF